MKRYLDAFRRLSLWQKTIVLVLLAIVLLTWLAVCLILLGVVGP